MLNQGTVTDNVAHVDLGVEMWSVVWPVYRNKCMSEGLALQPSDSMSWTRELGGPLSVIQFEA